MLNRLIAALLALGAMGVGAATPVQQCLDALSDKPASAGGSVNAHTANIEHGLWLRVIAEDTQAMDLAARMAYYAVPGVSVAVIHQGRIDWLHAWGARDAATCAPVTTETRFQVASISKSVSALLAMGLVEQGKLKLDADINASLQGWQLPKPETLQPDFVTLRQLLSHTGGLGVHGFPGYATDATRPSVKQILDGLAPANSPAVRIEQAPGASFQYSGGGYTIAQLAIEQASGKPLADWAAQSLFQPLQMHHSGFDQPPSRKALRNAARAHAQGNVIDGGFHVYPELAAAGLWTTPGDLARLLIQVQQAQAGEANSRLPSAMVRQMLTAQTDGWGLGFALKGEGDSLRFGHDGVNEGFESSMVAFANKGEGVVVTTNGQGGRQLADEIIRGIAADYGWTELAPRRVATVKVSDAILDTYVGAYEVPGIQVSIERVGTALMARIGSQGADRLLALSQTRFIAQDSAAMVEFEVAPDGEAASPGFRILEGGPPITVPRSIAAPVLIGATPIFLRGSMNDWSTTTAMRETTPQVFVAELQLKAGQHEFKLASEDWQRVDLGAAAAAPDGNADGKPISLVQHGRNLRLLLADGGTYRFSVDATGVQGPILNVSRID